MVWGLSLAGGVGGDFGLVGLVGCLWWVLVWLSLRGGVFASEGHRLPSLRARLFS